MTKATKINIAATMAGIFVGLLILGAGHCQSITRTQDEFTDKVILSTDYLTWYDPFKVRMMVASYEHTTTYFKNDTFLIMVILGTGIDKHIDNNPVRFIADDEKWGVQIHARLGNGCVTYKITKKQLWLLANSDRVKMRVGSPGGLYVFVIPVNVKAVLSELYLKSELETW